MTTFRTSVFPIRQNSLLIKRLSLLTAILMTLLSSIWIFFPGLIYPDPKTAESFLTNDLVNIILGLPFFVVSLGLIQNRKPLGWLLLPGALVYVIYNYLAYFFGRSLDLVSAAYALLVLLSAYTLLKFIQSVDHQEVKNRLETQVSTAFPGWVLIIFGSAFFALAGYQIINGLIQGSIPPLGEYAVSLADVVVSTLWFRGGMLLLRKRATGYTLALGLLAVTCTLFLGLILFFFLAPAITDRPFDWMEVVQILIMGMIGFVPTALYWRGVLKEQKGNNNIERTQ